MSDITVHCVKCGEVFSAGYKTIESWKYHCPKCRGGIEIVVHLDSIDVCGEDDEEG